MDMRLGVPLLALLVLAGGCEIEMAERNGSQSDDGKPVFTPLSPMPALETRTFQLEHLTSRAAIALIDPYVYGDRPGRPGTISNPTGIRAISVREMPDNLDKIARMLEQFDVVSRAPSSYRLHFQVVAGNGGTSDPRLAPVEAELRKVFRFDGYSLLGEGYVTVSRGGFDLSITPEDGTDFYHVDGDVLEGDQLGLTIHGPSITLSSTHSRSGGTIRTRLGFRVGQTLVLGSMPTTDKTVFVVVHVAEPEAEPT